jgi:hypothetical protein
MTGTAAKALEAVNVHGLISMRCLSISSTNGMRQLSPGRLFGGGRRGCKQVRPARPRSAPM